MKNSHAIIAWKITSIIKPNKKFNNTCQQKKIHAFGLFTKPSMIQKLYAGDIYNQGKIPQFCIRWDCKQMNWKTQEKAYTMRQSTSWRTIKANNIITCFLLSNTKIKASCHHICYFFKAFANCSILSTASWPMSESNLIKMRFTKCGSIWKKNPNVEVSAVIWDSNSKIHTMNLAIAMMDMIKIKLIA